jgi:predicted transport protein
LEREKDNPQLIFESLNSTGLDLSQADLIRNYVLMGQELDLQTELYENYWYPMESNYGNDYTTTFNWFMRDYLSVKTNQIPRIDRVYESFKNFVETDKTDNRIIDVVKDIYKFSEYYVNMVLNKEPDKDLNRAFKNIAKLKVDVSYPFLLPVYDDYTTGKINKDQFLSVTNYVENYVFRRAICGIPTNSLNKTFATLYKTFDKVNYVEGIEAAFQLMEGYKRFPTDTEFEKEITIKDLYNFRSRNYLLSKLENFNRKEFVNVDEYTIEHILPQNPDLSPTWQKMLGENWKQIQETYLHTLGNLTLTGYNSELSDRSFLEKKTIEGGFNKSPIRINSFLQQTDDWNEQTIQARASELASLATQIWKSPTLPPDVLDKYRPKEEKEVSIYTIDSYEHLKGEMLELYRVLSKRILNIDPTVKEEFKKFYIAFKSTTNFVDVVPQKTKLRLSLNIDFDEIIDPKGVCRDVSGLGRWGNGDVETSVKTLGELDYAMELIQQAFDVQIENV